MAKSGDFVAGLAALERRIDSLNEIQCRHSAELGWWGQETGTPRSLPSDRVPGGRMKCSLCKLHACRHGNTRDDAWCRVDGHDLLASGDWYADRCPIDDKRRAVLAQQLGLPEAGEIDLTLSQLVELKNRQLVLDYNGTELKVGDVLISTEHPEGRYRLDRIDTSVSCSLTLTSADTGRSFAAADPSDYVLYRRVGKGCAE